MARGDVVAEVESLANGSEMEFQPTGDLEYVLRSWSGERSATVFLKMTDESLDATICDGADGNLLAGTVMVPCNAGHYLIVRNDSGSTKVCAVNGYITNT